MAYRSTKTYGAERGLSACFRQWRAKSHCRLLHGYALGFRFVFEADELDENNWVVDFGALKPIKQMLDEMFDHKLVVAEDDPVLGMLANVPTEVADVVMLPSTGCEAFAEHVGKETIAWLELVGLAPRVRLVSVECFEHAANSALWTKESVR